MRSLGCVWAVWRLLPDVHRVYLGLFRESIPPPVLIPDDVVQMLLCIQVCWRPVIVWWDRQMSGWWEDSVWVYSCQSFLAFHRFLQGLMVRTVRLCNFFSFGKLLFHLPECWVVLLLWQDCTLMLAFFVCACTYITAVSWKHWRWKLGLIIWRKWRKGRFKQFETSPCNPFPPLLSPPFTHPTPLQSLSCCVSLSVPFNSLAFAFFPKKRDEEIEREREREREGRRWRERRRERERERRREREGRGRFGAEQTQED